MKSIQLYDYQSQMVRKIKDELARPSEKTLNGVTAYKGRSVMVQMPTGTGKTFVMAAVIRDFKVKGSVWIIAHRRELVEQMKETLTRFGITYKESRDMNDWGWAKVRVMSVQWLTRNIDKLRSKAQPGLIIIDEAHHSLAPTYQRMWTSFPDALKLGFTATPCRLKAASFSKLYDTLLTSWSIRRFIDERRLSLYDYVAINKYSEDQSVIDSLEKRGTDGDYSISEMEEKLNINQTIVRLFKSVDKFAHGKRGIVYAINIEHARNIAAYYTSQGLKAVAIDSNTPSDERKRLVDDFKQGKTDCLVNVNLFDEGFDCPDVEYIQMARPTLSLSKYLQMVGRGLRVHPDKKMCVLIDNVGLYRMFGLPDADRDWKRMFLGKLSGRGKITKNRERNLHIVDNDMEIIVNHSHFIPKSEEEEFAFRMNTVPFEKNGRWGLKSGDEIVLCPVYKVIEPFVGNYCAYSIAHNRWGILSRTGLVVVRPDYLGVKIMDDGQALLKEGQLLTWTINLRYAEQDAIKEKNWWRNSDRVAQKMFGDRKHLKRK